MLVSNYLEIITGSSSMKITIIMLTDKAANYSIKKTSMIFSLGFQP